MHNNPNLCFFIGNDGQFDKRNAKRPFTSSHKNPPKTSQKEGKIHSSLKFLRLLL